MPLYIALLIPLAGAILIAVCGRRPNLREAVTLLTGVALLLFVVSLLPSVLAGNRPGVTLFEIFPGVPIAFELEPLGMLFALVASGLWIVTSLYSIGYMRAHHEEHQTRFYVSFAVSIFGAMGVALAGNVLTLFLFYEVLTLSTYPLVSHHGTETAMKGARTYLGVLLSTSVGLLLLAVGWTWMLTGTLDFREGGILAGRADDGVLLILLALYAFGTGKAALMPFHRWLPAAMVAPTPVSALLHAVAVVKAGVFTVMKVVVYVFGLDLLTTTGDQRVAYVRGRDHDHCGLARRAGSGQSQAPARVLHREPAFLHRPRRGAGEFVGRRRGEHAHRDACFWEDHAVLLRRRDLRGGS